MRTLFRLMVLIGLIGLTLPSIAQEDDTTGESVDIVLEGPVQTINVNIITIANISIQVTPDDPVLTTLQPGEIVRVEGNANLAADTLVIVATAIVPSEATVINPVIVLTGPVQSVNVDIVTVFNLNIQFAPNHPLLTVVQIGDLVTVVGNIVDSGATIIVVPIQAVIVVIDDDTEATPEPTVDPDATPEASPEPGSDLPVTIVIEGPVEAINVNIITIYNFDIEIQPDDPILTNIVIGDILHVEGDTVVTNNTTIIVAINVTIINVDIIIVNNPDVVITTGLPSGCKVTKKGKIKCSKKSKRS